MAQGSTKKQVDAMSFFEAVIRNNGAIIDVSTGMDSDKVRYAIIRWQRPDGTILGHQKSWPSGVTEWYLE